MCLWRRRTAFDGQQSVALFSLDGVQLGARRERTNVESIPARLPTARQRARQAPQLCTRFPQTIRPLPVQYQDTRQWYVNSI